MPGSGGGCMPRRGASGINLTSFSGLLTFVEIARARIRSAGKGHINGRVTVTLGRWSNALGDP